MLALDIAAITYAIGGLGLYHLHVYSNVFCNPSAEQTQVGRMLSSANYWTKKHQIKEDPASVTLAIQTLRNTILVAVFVGGNAVNIAISYSNSFHELTDRNDQIRTIILSILCFCSFLSWVMVIRLASQLGYFVGTLNVVGDDEIEKELTSSSYQPIVPKDTIDLDIDDSRENDTRRKEMAATERKLVEENIKSIKLKKCTNLLILMFIFFSFGFRFLLLSIPFAFYTMGPISLIIATSLMLAFFVFYDYGVVYLSSYDRLKHD